MTKTSLHPPHYLSEWLAYKGLTQSQFGDLVGLTASAVSRIATGTKPLMQNRLKAFAGHLDIEVPDLFRPPPEPVRTLAPPPVQSRDPGPPMLGLVAVLAGIVRTLDGQSPGVRKSVESEVELLYRVVREAPDHTLEDLQLIRDFRELLRAR